MTAAPAPMPDGDDVAWTDEARQRLMRAPEFVRPGIIKLMAKRCREQGRTVVDSTFLTEIRNESMLLVAKCLRGFGFEELSLDAFEVARTKMRKLPRKVEVIGEIQRFLAARTEKNTMVLAKFQRYLDTIPERGLPWSEEALSRIQRVPESLRPLVRETIEAAAREARERIVSAAAVDRCLARAAAAPAAVEGAPRADDPLSGVTMSWTAEAEERVRRIPLAPIRAMVIRRTESWASADGLEVVDSEAYEAARRNGAALDR
ncbi:MAG: PCP reductase family protein [Candidatus Rokubacteria bacterium]|nr:PCP reductase family protein [Candidatus Rokubacteria bacterium]